MYRQGVEILKCLAEPSEDIENLLMADRAALTSSQVSGVLDKARPAYTQVLEFYKNLCHIATKNGIKLDKECKWVQRDCAM